MISHKHKCIFVHIPKAAGSSIEQMFLNDLNWEKEIGRVPLLLLINPSSENGPPRLSHLTGTEYVKYNYVSKQIFDDYFTFGWVRNPYGRIYSFYKYFCYDYFVSFEKFVTVYLKKNYNHIDTRYFYKPMYDYLYEDNSLAVDFVGKLESIYADIEVVIKRVGITTGTLPHKNKSNNIRFKLKMRRLFDVIIKHPSIFLDLTFSKNKKKKKYNEEMIEVLKELYSKDFDAFNYEY